MHAGCFGGCQMKYAEALLDQLKENFKFTHCFFLAGGNNMHLLDAARTRFKCIPVVHEVAAGIAVEYFNEANIKGNKAFAIVTAGPGLTNIVTAAAGAFLESRELLILGGQVKLTDLKNSEMRQRGIQEIDGVSIMKSISAISILLEEPKDLNFLSDVLNSGSKPGPIFIEIPLDIQAVTVDRSTAANEVKEKLILDVSAENEMLDELLIQLEIAERPVLLLGGGISRKFMQENLDKFEKLNIPIMTTWNSADRYSSEHKNYWGRPNTWGQRYSNILIQQSDVLVAVGTRLGLQQTGFAWEKFAPVSKIFQIDFDINELKKGHPKIYKGLASDADHFMKSFFVKYRQNESQFNQWLAFGSTVKSYFPLNDKFNITSPGFVDPFKFIENLSVHLNSQDVIVPCSSGGAFTVTLQALETKQGQIIISNKGLASMGYGLSGSIGAAISTGRRTILIEGDGGFAQNLQELGTVAAQNLNLKIFIFCNNILKFCIC